jgi:MSHA pilin protein MshA
LYGDLEKSMNKQAMHTVRQSAQAGFTLIELIVVIVILGILAATALPRFASLGGDARIASLQAARGALNTTVSMVHGQYLLNPATVTASGVTNEGVNVTVASGYPTALTNTAIAAGLTTSDYEITLNSTGSDVAATAGHVPAIPAKGFVVVPNSIKGTATAETCFVSYKEAVDANTPPVITVTSTACQ